MRPASRIAVVVGGYLAAFALACVAVWIHVAATTGPAAQASSGMMAFGDSLLFLGVFGLAAIPATGVALYFLRPYRTFWIVLSVLALLVTATGLISLIDARSAPGESLLGEWAVLAPLRVLVAPLFALAFLFCGLFAPVRFARFTLLGATAVEGIVFAAAAIGWLR
jgi:hypothetical protein